MRRPQQPHAQLEKELAGLMKQQQTDSRQQSNVKQRVRVIKNRLSAKRSREQQRAYVQNLESTVAYLSAQAELMAQRLASVEAENARMRDCAGFPGPISWTAPPARAKASNNNYITPMISGVRGPATGQASAKRKNECLSEPAVLPHASLQLDALLLLATTATITNGAQETRAYLTSDMEVHPGHPMSFRPTLTSSEISLDRDLLQRRMSTNLRRLRQYRCRYLRPRTFARGFLPHTVLRSW
mmetsp:Transcript_6086/g.9707  ORF Transcript_6086/g.9707 Transcript_6086/m.9707 type:complete len:242 (-) Transcript_6086:355-1080(-)